MDTVTAARLARSLMNQHDLGHWAFQWDNAKRRAGVCYWNRRVIGLSRPIVILNPEPFVRNTILHEIAHALAGPQAGHGPVWKAIARSIGCDGQRCYRRNDVAIPDAAWVGTCSNGHTTSQTRAPLRVKSCVKCSRRFDFNHLFHWKKNGRKVPLAQMPVRYRQEFIALEARWGAKKISA